jgi:hypothetical protein
VRERETMVKYLFLATLICALVLAGAGCVEEPKETGAVTVYFFYGEGCPHCHDVMPFIQNLTVQYPDVEFHILEVWGNETNRALFSSYNQQLGLQKAGVPEVIVVGNSTPLLGSRDIPLYLEEMIREQQQKQSS